MKRPPSGKRARAPEAGDAGCGKMVELLSDYVDGDLDAALKRSIDEHGGRCPPCRAFVNTLRATVKAVRRLPGEQLEPRAIRALAEALRRAGGSR